MIIINEIHSATRLVDGSIDFLVNATVEGSEMTNVVFTYPNRKRPEAHNTCKEWLVNNTPSEQTFTEDVEADRVRDERDTLLSRADGVSIKHREQVDLGITPDLTDAQYQQLLQYKQDLRDVPSQETFPTTVDWPVWPLQRTK